MEELCRVLMTEKYWTRELFSEEIFWELISAYSQPKRMFVNKNQQVN
jgi:hypothetical protein